MKVCEIMSVLNDKFRGSLASGMKNIFHRSQMLLLKVLTARKLPNIQKTTLCKTSKIFQDKTLRNTSLAAKFKAQLFSWLIQLASLQENTINSI